MSERRINTLRLAARDETLVRRGAILIEDALRTATMPETRRLLFIRKLRLGKIRAGASPAAVALAIEQEMQRVGLTAVYADNPRAENADAVYFADEIEPYVLLLAKLARFEHPKAWFFPKAVQGWTPDLPDPIRRVVHWLNAQHGARGLAVMVAELYERGRLDAVLETLTMQDGAILLRAFGALSAEPRLREIPALVMRLSHWFVGWGADDARSTWLAAAALAAENPARLASPLLMAQAATVVRQAARPAETPEQLETRTRCDEAKGSEAAPQQHKNGENAPSESQTPAATAVRDDDPAPESQAEAPDAIYAPDDEPTTYFTRYAGLYLLLPLLIRLQMGAFLDAHPDLWDAAFPARWLAEVSIALGADTEDAAVVALTPLSPLPHGEGEKQGAGFMEFIVPSAWWMGLTSRRALFLVPLGAGQHALMDGRLVLAAWQGRMPPSVRDHVNAHSVGARHALPLQATSTASQNSLTLLFDTWHVAAQRWLRRFAHTDLAAVVQRPGRIAFTRSHIDVYFDHSRAELSIRRAGLDLDPGWVAWFGRVVTFHYVHDAYLQGADHGG